MSIAAVYILFLLVIPLLLFYGNIKDGYEAISSCFLTIVLCACVFIILSL
jgi:hypothetical protein